MSGAEGLGEIVTGGMFARTAEPQAGEAGLGSDTGQGSHTGHACLNCGTGLVGSYCHRCGQAGHVHRTIGAFFHDLAHGVLHLDGKIWRTLPMLAWRPGELTRRYVEGERARFLSPMALFLFSVFLMFAVIQTIGGPFDTGQVQTSGLAETRREFAAEQAENLKKLEDLRAERNRLAGARQPTDDVDRDIAGVERDMKLEEQLFRQAIVLTGGDGVIAAGEGKLAGRGNGKLDANTGIPGLDAALERAGRNPDLLLYKAQSNAYKYSWALIPISVPFLWLLFLHRRRYWQHGAYDHVVFVTYSIAFMSLGFVLLSLLRPLGGEAIAGVAIAFVPPIHMYRQLRGAYRLSRPSALWRTAALLLFAAIAAGLFMSMVLALGL